MNKSKKKIFVSACLAGYPCRYNGSEAVSTKVKNLVQKGLTIPVCPEQLAGFPTPRPSCEIMEGKVIEDSGKDVTAMYEKGAQAALEIAQMYGCQKAILKNKSPMCGTTLIYDGTFSGTTMPGKAVLAKVLEKHGIETEPGDS